VEVGGCAQERQLVACARAGPRLRSERPRGDAGAVTSCADPRREHAREPPEHREGDRVSGSAELVEVPRLEEQAGHGLAGGRRSRVRRRAVQRELAERVARPGRRQHGLADADSSGTEQQETLDRRAGAEERLVLARRERSEHLCDGSSLGLVEVAKERACAYGLERCVVSSHTDSVGAPRDGAKPRPV
jgi:hypothetical protein